MIRNLLAVQVLVLLPLLWLNHSVLTNQIMPHCSHTLALILAPLHLLPAALIIHHFEEAFFTSHVDWADDLARQLTYPVSAQALVSGLVYMTVGLQGPFLAGYAFIILATCLLVAKLRNQPGSQFQSVVSSAGL